MAKYHVFPLRRGQAADTALRQYDGFVPADREFAQKFQCRAEALLAEEVEGIFGQRHQRRGDQVGAGQLLDRKNVAGHREACGRVVGGTRHAAGERQRGIVRGRDVLVLVARDMGTIGDGCSCGPHACEVIGRDPVEFHAPDPFAGEFVGIGADLSRGLLTSVEIDQQTAAGGIFEHGRRKAYLVESFAVHEVDLQTLYAAVGDAVHERTQLEVIFRRVVQLLPMPPYEEPDALSGRVIRHFPKRRPFVRKVLPPFVERRIFISHFSGEVDNGTFAFDGHVTAVDAAPPAPERPPGAYPRRIAEKLRIGCWVEVGDDVRIDQPVEVFGYDQYSPRRRDGVAEVESLFFGKIGVQAAVFTGAQPHAAVFVKCGFGDHQMQSVRGFIEQRHGLYGPLRGYRAQFRCRG